MKVKNDFILHPLGEEYVVVPIDDRAKYFQGMIRLNDTGAFLWKRMEEEITKEELLQDLLKEYKVSVGQATEAVDMFLSKLKEAELIEG